MASTSLSCLAIWESLRTASPSNATATFSRARSGTELPSKQTTLTKSFISSAAADPQKFAPAVRASNPAENMSEFFLLGFQVGVRMLAGGRAAGHSFHHANATALKLMYFVGIVGE